MKLVVTRERNKNYYRVLHVPIWIWVFWVLPGHLTYTLYKYGPDRRHWYWLAVVVVVCAWRSYVGRLPGCETQPYIRYWGQDLPNLPYRVICYTAAWIDLMVPFAINLIGLTYAFVTRGTWLVDDLYHWLYYPLAALIVLATVFDITPRTRRSTIQEGAERAWLYIAIWTVVPTQIVNWAMWRIGKHLDVTPQGLADLRFFACVFTAGLIFTLGVKGKLPRTARYYATREDATAAAVAAESEA